MLSPSCAVAGFVRGPRRCYVSHARIYLWRAYNIDAAENLLFKSSVRLTGIEFKYHTLPDRDNGTL
jgi:hypothetical protein